MVLRLRLGKDVLAWRNGEERTTTKMDKDDRSGNSCFNTFGTRV